MESNLHSKPNTSLGPICASSWIWAWGPSDRRHFTSGGTWGPQIIRERKTGRQTQETSTWRRLRILGITERLGFFRKFVWSGSRDTCGPRIYIYSCGQDWNAMSHSRNKTKWKMKNLSSLGIHETEKKLLPVCTREGDEVRKRWE